jgi:hypothetical protein
VPQLSASLRGREQPLDRHPFAIALAWTLTSRPRSRERGAVTEQCPSAMPGIPVEANASNHVEHPANVYGDLFRTPSMRAIFGRAARVQ